MAPSDELYDQRRIVAYGGIFQEPQGIPFRYDDLSDRQKRAFGSDLAAGSPDDHAARQVLDYVRGRDFDPYRKRVHVLGDIVHSAPVLAGETLFVGANDGMLHAFDARTGHERFAYVPHLVFDQLKALAAPAYAQQHRYFVDATPSVGEVLVGPYQRKTFLLGGLGKGGKGYYCLLLGSREREGAGNRLGDYEARFSVEAFSGDTPEQEIAKIVQWEYPQPPSPTDDDSSADPDMGYSFGQGYVVNANAPGDGYRPVAIFGNGYNSDSGKAVLYVVEAASGTVVRKIDTGVDGDNGLSVPALVDVNADRRVDYVYAGDLKGNLWKFDLSADDPLLWGVAYGADSDRDGRIDAADGDDPQPLFRAASHQAITGRPDVMAMNSACAAQAPGYMVIFGTGRYLGVSDRADVRQQSVYGIWDYGDDSDDSEHVGYLTDRSTGRLSSDLFLVKRAVVAQDETNGMVARQLSEWRGDFSTVEDTADADGINTNNRTPIREVNPSRYAGWYFDFPVASDAGGEAGERVTGDVMIRNGKAVVVSFVPGDGLCGSRAASWMYILDGCGASDAPVNGSDATPSAVRHSRRIHENLIVVKEARSPGKDVILAFDGFGRILKQEFLGELWGKVFWRQQCSEE
ncbi:MAG: hypothetical protein VR64_24210 [Desulfatitalea sp. BRH_c12]|nr:MAG: hypothetical protein VR64_24210 [Desulfatitalea sp. BRH_c12]